MSTLAAQPKQPPKHVVVIGAGAIGAVSAVELLRLGHRVTILDPKHPGGKHAASYGNSGWVSPSLVVPLSQPGLWRKIPRYLLNPVGPLSIRWRHLPRLAPWLVRFLWAGRTAARVERTALALKPLVADCHLRHDELAGEAGVADLFLRTGQLQVYRSRLDFEAEAFYWHLRRLTGCSWTEIDEAELRRQEPTLNPRYTFGVVLGGFVCVKPGAYVSALVRLAERRGALLRQGHALGFHVEGDHATAVKTDVGDIPCDEIVIAAGVRSKALAIAAGDCVSLVAERGYHVELVGLEPMPRNRVLLMDHRMTNTPSRYGLRVTGHVEIADVDTPADWRHAAVLRRFTLGAYGFDREPTETHSWMGERPSTPDGLPIIGRASKLGNVIHAFGHGHIGVAASPSTARAVVDLVEGRVPAFDLSPYSAQRFRLFGAVPHSSAAARADDAFAQLRASAGPASPKRRAEKRA
ncbi:FAD-binding oxidoreductase [Bradyrhizobium sp. B124]|uniref:NAD(P)/FAD-dependent oxidoreductase n=1 Tax=Bradyrhizobium sp. B124 TaxID=3140245 RepID=UPI003182E9C1